MPIPLWLCLSRATVPSRRRLGPEQAGGLPVADVRQVGGSCRPSWVDEITFEGTA